MELSDNLVSVDFPGDIEYIPDVRRFLSNLINLKPYSRRFAFRMEIIIDELCTNAIKFGNLRVGEFVSVRCKIGEESVTLDVCNPSADPKEILNLRKAIATGGAGMADTPEGIIVGRGIQIVKILCNSIQVLEENGTVVLIVKKKEENEEL
jgi:anti-sigma regulatory factor (Ser/Thr protein kinase)